jgi:hypothetical protein
VVTRGHGSGGVLRLASAPAGAATPVTRAALDPALVSGRGATVPFLEQEAEAPLLTAP